MDRQTQYIYEVPAETDFMYAERFAYEGLGLMAKDLLGSTTLASGLACNPNSPAALNVLISPGRLYSLQNLEPTAWGSNSGVGGLAADTNADHQIVKQGILRDTTTLATPAPGSVGQSINYLIQATFTEADNTPLSLPFVSSTPPYPPVAPATLNTVRADQCVVAVKAGTAAATGSQTTPAPDAGYVGLWVVTVANGQATVIAGNISAYSPSSFIGGTLPQKANLSGAAFTGAISAPSIAPNGSTAPALGIWNPASNTIGIVGNSAGASVIQLGASGTTKNTVWMYNGAAGFGNFLGVGGAANDFFNGANANDFCIGTNSYNVWLGYSGAGAAQLNLTVGANAGSLINYTSGGGHIFNGSSLVVGSGATGGNLGAGKINVATGVYLNGGAYTNPDYVFEHWATGKIELFASNAKVMGEEDYAGPMPLPALRDFARANLHLPRFGQHARWDFLLGAEAMLATIEELHLYIFGLHDRISTLEGRA